MDDSRFERLVARLEVQSAAAPAAYRAKVVALMLLGFSILLLVLGVAGLGVALLAGVVVVMVASGGTALLVLLKAGKAVVLLAIPLWLLIKASVKALFVRLPEPAGREITRREAPALFAAIDDMRRRLRGPRVHHVKLVDEVNAAVVQRPLFGLLGFPRNHLLLGLPLMEAMPPAEMLAVVAHEYGHLAGAHGRFTAFVYRLRHTWGTLQVWADEIQGWLGRLVAPLVRWYAPYFNAYTFVLARSNEFEADACSADLVGATQAAQALKRSNLIGPRHQRFIERTFERVPEEPLPPPDLSRRWAAENATPPPPDEARRWLAEALDRPGRASDTHPTLRARLAALGAADGAPDTLPPPLAGSAAEAWLGPLAATLRQEFDARWAAQVREPWQQRHREAAQERAEWATLNALAERSAEQQFELLRLTLRLQPQTDLREPLAAFNAAHPDHASGLYLQAVALLDHDDRAGLDLLERVIALDAEATKPACERAHACLQRLGDPAGAEAWAARWRERDALETARAQQLNSLDAKKDALAPHGLNPAMLQALQDRLLAQPLNGLAHAWVARRVIPADPTAVQYVLGLQLGWLARRLGRQQKLVDRVVALEWPLALVCFTLDGRYAGFRKKFRALPGAQIL